MAGTTLQGGGGRMSPWRILGWGAAAALLIAPAAAMRFAPGAGVNWTTSDFVVAAVLIGGVGVALEAAGRMSRSWAWRGGAAAALAAMFLIVWANGAVGMIGDEGNRYNLFFYAVIFLALGGAVAARFRARGMAIAMVAAAAAQAGLGLAGMAQDPRGGMLSTAFAGLWLLSALLFRIAAREREGA